MYPISTAFLLLMLETLEFLLNLEDREGCFDDVEPDEKRWEILVNFRRKAGQRDHRTPAIN